MPPLHVEPNAITLREVFLLTHLPVLDDADVRIRALLTEKKWDEALKVYEEITSIVAPEDMEPAFHNNSAVCFEALNRLEEALAVVKGNISSAVPDPFSHALAARVLKKLGRDAEAEIQMREAVADFERGARASGRLLAKAWRDYLVILENAAGALEDHRLVLEIHQRWAPYYVTNENNFYAGAAAFNLGRYRQAAGYWRPRSHDDWSDILERYAIVAGEVEQGLVPPFTIPYRLHDSQKSAAEGARERYEPWEIVPMVAELAAKRYNDRLTKMLCQFTGDWGERLARNLARDSTVPEKAKQLAVLALVMAGRHPANEPFEIVVGGRRKTVTVEKRQVVFDDEKAQAVVERARALQEAGQREEAVSILREVCKESALYAPAAAALAEMLHERGELSESAGLLELLRDIEPENRQIALNLASIYGRLGDMEAARAVFDTIHPSGEDADFLKKYNQLKEGLYS